MRALFDVTEHSANHTFIQPLLTSRTQSRLLLNFHGLQLRLGVHLTRPVSHLQIIPVRVLGKVAWRHSSKIQLVDLLERDTLRLRVEVVSADRCDQAEPREDVPRLATEVASIWVDYLLASGK